MPNKARQAKADPSNINRKGCSHDSILPVIAPTSPSEDETRPSAVSGPSTESPEATDEELARWVGRCVLKGVSTVWKHVIARWKPLALGVVTAGGFTTSLAMISPAQVREMDGYVPVLKAQRKCTAPLSTTSTTKEIDDFLADSKNYDGLEKDVWEIFVNAAGEFRGTQWLRTRGNSPMRVSGYIAKGDWIDGALRGIKGHGAYHLEARNAEDDYRGTLTSLECSLPTDVVIECPYSLVPKDTPESEVGLAGRVCRRYTGPKPSAT